MTCRNVSVKGKEHRFLSLESKTEVASQFHIAGKTFREEALK